MRDEKDPLANVKPYQGTVSPFALDEIFIQDAFAKDDERLWMPVTPYSWSRPLCLCASQGYWVHLSKYRGQGVVSCHRHPAPVHALIIKGGWRYLEHDWTGREGSYVFEPPGDIHTLVTLPNVEESITLFNVTGSLIYFDETGETTGYADVFTRIDAYAKHFENVGLGADYVKQFIR
ncbi:MAG: 2,4'-dihydroxyacetophenone dioxygenase [Hyphomicrobiaceae bacterium]|jgi:2,4'-dihydroxyacetophenone dioxygenase